MQENVGTWTGGQVLSSKCLCFAQAPAHTSCFQAAKGSTAQLVDVPGHAKVRSRFESYMQDARGVIYVVDSVDFMGQKTAVAE